MIDYAPIKQCSSHIRCLDRLRNHVRSALDVSRLLLDEILESRFSHGDPEVYRNLVRKAANELAILLRLAKRALPSAEDSQVIFTLAADLASLARTPHAYQSLLLRPSHAPKYAFSHFCLTKLGVHDDHFDHVARLALKSSTYAANERAPYRMLDAAWVRHLALGDAELDHPALPLSPLGVGVDLLAASTQDAYTFTHALAYATDFGRVPLPPKIDRRQLLGIAEALAVKALDEDDLDLLMEVLRVPALLRLRWTPTLSFAWHVLERVWTECGFVFPPAAPRASRYRAVRQILGPANHTVFAAGICCATVIACDDLPPECECAAPGTIELPPGNGSAWQVNWNQAPYHVQEQLLFLRLAFALKRAIEDMDFIYVGEILTAAVDFDLIEHPLFTQALELLERVAA